MALKQSTGLCQALLTTSDFKSIFDGGYLIIYSGSVPATADAADDEDNILVVVAEDSTPATDWVRPFGGTGGTFDEPVAGVISKAAAEVWEGEVRTAAPNGYVATHWRLVKSDDTGASSTTQPRIQGTIGLGGTDMVVGNTTLVAAANFPVNFFTLSLVPS